jgi:hypothetical protein
VEERAEDWGRRKGEVLHAVGDKVGGEAVLPPL